MTKIDKISLPNVNIERYQYTDMSGGVFYIYFLYINGVFEQSFKKREDCIKYLQTMIIGEVY